MVKPIPPSDELLFTEEVVGYIPNLQRPRMPRYVSSQIPVEFHDYRRCERKSRDEILLYFRIRNERNVRNIQRENASLRQLVLCRICLSRESRVVFQPCGHLWICEIC
ncbi:hypothetical protein DPMN_107011 [Dreissena polymorpha]|uniref:RING-type domain-containing protein n=1 Tax=Dreissena polymorpha TaxID=45954 RepID=A0A9D4QJP9_DREPO|nr:hypothetical protein DPMN_107011 [Dreissena polymorpha]